MIVKLCTHSPVAVQISEIEGRIEIHPAQVRKDERIESRIISNSQRILLAHLLSL